MKKLVTALMILTGLFPALGSAEADSTQIRTYRLETIRVIAETPVQQIGAAENLFISEEDRAAHLDVASLVNEVPGLVVTHGSKGEASINLRGFDRTALKVFVNGRALNTGYFGFFDLHNIPVSNIEHIQILKGPVSPLFGTNNMGGVINIISRNPHNNPRWSIGLQTKRNQTFKADITHQRYFTTWDYRLSLTALNSKGEILSSAFEDTLLAYREARENSFRQQYELQFNINSDISDWHRLGLDIGFLYNPRRHMPGKIDEIITSSPRYRRYLDLHRWHTYLSHEWITKGDLAFAHSLGLDRSGDRYEEHNSDAYDASSLRYESWIHTLMTTYNARADWAYSPAVTLTCGVGLEHRSNKRKDNRDYLQWSEKKLVLSNVYLFNQYHLNSHWRGGMGLALSHLWRQDSDNENNRFNPEPSIGIYYQSPQGTDLSISAARNVSYPTMRQLYSLGSGNPDLKSQKAYKYETSLRCPLPRAIVPGTYQVTAFLNDVTDMIDRVRIDGVNTFRNVRQLITYGGELGLTFQPLGIWESGLTYALLLYDKSSDLRLTNVARNSATMTNRIDLMPGTQFRLTNTWTDHRYSNIDRDVFVLLPSYWKHDAAISYSHDRYTLSAGVENFLDTTYDEEYSYPAAGLNYFFGLRAEW